MDVRRVTLKDQRQFDVTVTVTKDPEIPFPTLMLVQGANVIAVALPVAALLTLTMREVAREFLRSGRIAKARAVRIAEAAEFIIVVTATKDRETPFPTLMLIQEQSILAVPFASGESLARAMKSCADEFVREAAGGIVVL